MIGFCGGNFFWKKSLPRTPFQKTFILYKKVWIVQTGRRKSNRIPQNYIPQSLPVEGG